jgi:hypothetical protein
MGVEKNQHLHLPVCQLCSLKECAKVRRWKGNNLRYQDNLLFAAHPIVCKKQSLVSKPQASQAAAVLWYWFVVFPFYFDRVQIGYKGFILGSFDSAIAGIIAQVGF